MVRAESAEMQSRLSSYHRGVYQSDNELGLVVCEP